MKLDKKAFEKWNGWCDSIKNDITILQHFKQIQDYLFEIVTANADHIDKNHGGIFRNFIRECYGCYIAVGVRRLVKPSSDKNSITLIRLLEQIKNCSNQFTYKFYLEMYPINDREWQKSVFNNFSDDGIIISESKIKTDIEELEEISKKVCDFVDRRIAHTDKKASNNITFKDITDPLEPMEKVFCKYYLLLTGWSALSLTPAIQYNWKQIFKVPLDIRS